MLNNLGGWPPLRERCQQELGFSWSWSFFETDLGGGPQTWDSRSLFLRCNPAGFDIGSDRRGCDGWVDESAIYLINIKSLIGGCACGDVGEGEHFLAFRAGAGSAAGRQRRSSTYPHALLVNLPRCAITEALVLTLGVVKVQPGANTGLGFGNRRISMEVDLFVFEAAPQPLDKDVVHAPALAVHADHDAMPLQGAGKVVTGEVAPLVGIEDFRPAMARKRFPERLDAKIGVERVGETPG